MSEHKFPYEWKLSDGYPAKGIAYHGSKVFSCFSCGGGSTMGYKLAGYQVIGDNEIDPKMNACYVSNHHPKHNYLEPIQTLKLREDLHEDLFNLDILDGSPPCSSFSMAGSRDKDWGKKKKFREGQQEQILDTLFFDFIDLAKKLKPKVIIAENVKGLLVGEAVSYLNKICIEFRNAGYKLNYKLLNANVMGVPQSRERIFFYGIRNDLSHYIEFEDIFQEIPYLNLEFNEKQITYKEIEKHDIVQDNITHIPEGILPYWEKIKPGRACSDVHEKGHFFQELKLHPDKPLPTLRAGSNSYYHYKDPRRLYDIEIMLGGSYPLDYDFKTNKPIYMVGMSVPPVMTAQIAHRIYEQWLSKIK